MAVRFNDNSMVVGSEEMENADNGNECFMPVFSNEQDEKSFFLKLSDTLKSKHINVKHKHREKELEILFFENKQELYNSINKP